MESPYNASLINADHGSASLRASDPALSLLPGQENTAILGFYVNATSAVSKHLYQNTSSSCCFISAFQVAFFIATVAFDIPAPVLPLITHACRTQEPVCPSPPFPLLQHSRQAKVFLYTAPDAHR